VAPVLARGAALEAGVAAAGRQAEAWQSGAGGGLLSASMQVDWPWDPPPARPRTLPPTGWLTVVLLAPADSEGGETASLSLVIDRLTGEIVAQDVVAWPTAPPLPPRPSPAVDSATALLAAEGAGGTNFRRACPIERHASRVSLLAAAGADPVWLVTYEDARQPARAGLEVRVDAGSGAALAVEESAPACPGGG